MLRTPTPTCLEQWQWQWLGEDISKLVFGGDEPDLE
jgi:hypothetical protein